MGIMYVYNYAVNNSSTNCEGTDYCEEETCKTIRIKKGDLDKTINAIKKLKKNMKTMV